MPGSDLDPLRPRVKVRHLVLAVLCLMYFIAYIDRVNIAVAGPAIRRELGLSATELGLIFSAFAYPYAAMQIAGGWASDRFGPRRVLAALSSLWAVCRKRAPLSPTETLAGTDSARAGSPQ